MKCAPARAALRRHRRDYPSPQLPGHWPRSDATLLHRAGNPHDHGHHYRRLRLHARVRRLDVGAVHVLTAGAAGSRRSAAATAQISESQLLPRVRRRGCWSTTTPTSPYLNSPSSLASTCSATQSSAAPTRRRTSSDATQRTRLSRIVSLPFKRA